MAIKTPEITPEPIQPTTDMVVLDIGKRDADAVRKLRKGKGKLLRKVNHAIEQLSDAGKISKDAQIVMIVVREKNTSWFGDDSDDD